jgi:hypothetical protein
MARTTRSAARAASSTVAARALLPSSAMRSVMLAGPREFARTTRWPAWTALRATWLPTFPVPMTAIVDINGRLLGRC